MPAWNTLTELALANDQPTIAQLFRADPRRAQTMSFEVPGTEIYLDFSRQNVTDLVRSALLELAREAQVEEQRSRLAAGEVVNASEGRAARHMAERAASLEATTEVAGARILASKLAEEIRSGEVRGVGGPFTDVVNVGIGGSDLGPKLVHQALSSVEEARLRVRFVSNIDQLAFTTATRDLDPRTTLFVFCSKSFGTVETVVNAKRAQEWLGLAMSQSDVSRHCVVVSATPDRAREASIRADHSLTIPMEVGGRYSVASAMNFCNEIAFGSFAIDRFREGMAMMDAHFMNSPLDENAPVLMGLVDVWNRSFLGRTTRAVVTYSDALVGLVPFVQQLEMESNGKMVRQDGSTVTYPTSPVVWGGVGTDAQHAFMQLIHQGTDVVPVDFVGVSRSTTGRNDELIANMVAQAEALATGRSIEQVRRSGVVDGEASHRVMPGNRPSTVVVLRHLSPATLGALIALYEHATFVQGAVWGIDSFDQWGVELGKQMALDILNRVGGNGTDRSGDSDLPAVLAWHLSETP